MSYKIIISIDAEDLHDVKSHLSIIREQIVSVIKQNPDNPESPISYTGINSGHDIQINSTEQ